MLPDLLCYYYLDARMRRTAVDPDGSHWGDSMDAERYADYMYNLIDRVINEIGPREACSAEEKRTGRLFAEEIKPACDRINVETFTCSPKAFLGFFPFLVLGYIAGVVLYFFIPPVSLILAAIGIAVLYFEVVRYKEFIDFLYPRREGENVAGIVRPSGDINRRFIVSAHFDSAYEFKIWYWFKNFSVAIMALAFTAPVLLLIFSLLRTIFDAGAESGAVVWLVLGIILIALSPIIIPFIFFHTKDLVPGAMDNMAGVSVLAGLARYLQDAGESGEFYPENTEVVLLGMSSEEAGLRGAKRYASKHRKEMLSLPTYSIFLDGIYDEQYLSIVKKEMWPGAKHDPYLVGLGEEAARKNKLKYRTGVLPLGSTDASAFSLEGISAVAIMCVDNSRLPVNYHTRYDTIEYIRPESLAVSLQVVIDMLKSIDRG